MIQNKSFKFVTNSLNYEEVGSKSDKNYYVKGYISTDEVDRANEVVTREAMNDMVAQIKAGNVKLDVEHSTFAGESDIPVGKIVDAGVDDNGVWVKCTLNKHHSKFSEIWKSVKDGFLDAFSIAYKVTSTAAQVINGVQVTLLKGLELLNVAITGNPVCRGAKMSESFYKSLKYINENTKSEDEKMVDEVKPEPVVEKPKVEEVKVEEPKVEEVKVEKPKIEEPVVEEVKEEPKVEEVKVEEPVVEKVVEESPKPLDTIKNMTKEIAELKANIKSLKAVINKPKLKAVGNTDISEVKDVRVKSPLQVIN